MAKKTISIDDIQNKLIYAVEWSAKNGALVLSAIGIFIVAGVAYSVYGYFDTKKETTAQETYYKVDHAYSEKKREFAQKNVTTFKAETLEKDLGTIPEDFQKIINAQPHSQAAKMSALQLIEIYAQYGLTERADDIYKQLGNLKVSDLTSGLLLFQKANILVNFDKCADAVSILDQLIKAETTSYFKNEAQLRKAICLEKLGQAADAEKIYTELSQIKNQKVDAKSEPNESEAQISSEAQKYLRLMKMKKI